MKTNRNDLCPCGSGKKYKHCCLTKVTSSSPIPSAVSVADLKHFDALFQEGRYGDLEVATYAFIQKHPEDGAVWKLLSMALQMQNKDALDAFNKAAELLPENAEAHANLAAALRAAGKFGQAIESGRRALQINPDFAEAHNNLGVALQDMGLLDEAILSYRRAIKLKPNFVEPHSNLGSALKEMELFDDAIASYQRALEIRPNYAKVHSNLGVVQQWIGQLDNAVASYNKALECDPKCKEAMLGISQLCMQSGELESAEQVLDTVLKIDSGSFDARFLLSQINKAKVGDENMVALIAADNLARNNSTSMPVKQAIHLHFALGKCFDDTHDYAQAFHHFSEGCRLKRDTFKHDADQVSQSFDDIIRIFSKETVARLSGIGNLSPTPIFILGMPRSGTTLTEQILSSHPEVYGAGELPDLLDIVLSDKTNKETSYPNNIATITPDNLANWAEKYLARLIKHAPEARHITDKMPDNFLALGLIHVMFPNAKIIHVNRNPIDTCFSCFSQLFTRGQHPTYDLVELGRYYVDYSRLMQHWCNVLPADAFLDVHYENIVADQEKEARRITDFCNLAWNDACINFHEYNRSVQTASLVQVRQPLYSSSVERWRRYEQFLDPLIETLGDLASH